MSIKGRKNGMLAAYAQWGWTVEGGVFTPWLARYISTMRKTIEGDSYYAEFNDDHIRKTVMCNETGRTMFAENHEYPVLSPRDVVPTTFNEFLAAGGEIND